MPTTKTNLLALDVGERRIGVAVANVIARLPRPLTVLSNDTTTWEEIIKLVAQENAGTVVVGLPRSLNSEDTDQTRFVRNFAAVLKEKTDALVVLQDEALTSRQAEAELRGRGKQYAKGDIDALAATYILEDYLRTIDSVEMQS
jgi:putative holliday junction resolvase